MGARPHRSMLISKRLSPCLIHYRVTPADSPLKRNHEGVLFYEHQDKNPHFVDCPGHCGYGDPDSHFRTDPHLRCAPKTALVRGYCTPDLQYRMRRPSLSPEAHDGARAPGAGGGETGSSNRDKITIQKNTQGLQVVQIPTKNEGMVIAFGLRDKFSNISDLNCQGISAKSGVIAGQDLS